MQIKWQINKFELIVYEEMLLTLPKSLENLDNNLLLHWIIINTKTMAKISLNIVELVVSNLELLRNHIENCDFTIWKSKFEFLFKIFKILNEIH